MTKSVFVSLPLHNFFKKDLNLLHISKKSDNIKRISVMAVMLILLTSFLLGYLLYFNNPPQGAIFQSLKITDADVRFYGTSNDNFTAEINGTVNFMWKIPDNPYETTPLKIEIDIRTNESLGIDREIVTSKNVFLNMSYNENYPLNEKINFLTNGSYRMVITIYALQPNNFWGTHWEAVGKETFYLNA